MFKMIFFSKKLTLISVVCISLILISTTFCFSGFGLRERLKERWQRQSNSSQAAVSTDSKCDKFIPGIAEGYGAEGPYDMDIKTIGNPLWKNRQISIFFPKSAGNLRPVILFSHAYGAVDWKRVYSQFIQHMVSRGYIVVYSPYQTFRASFDERYATLWKGFELAVKNYGHLMDLTRVGFVGHSFGGGATPKMAYNGFVNRGWGKNGAFMYILAPWYSFQITPEELRQFPDHMVLVVQIYDKDHTNDHRMAIDIYRSVQLPDNQKYFQLVSSKTINGCEIVADHKTPSRNPSLRLKQYAVFKTFDALVDYVFNGNPIGYQFISNPSSSTGYQPLQRERRPEPRVSEKTFRFPWSSNTNQRRSIEKW